MLLKLNKVCLCASSRGSGTGTTTRLVPTVGKEPEQLQEKQEFDTLRLLFVCSFPFVGDDQSKDFDRGKGKDRGREKGKEKGREKGKEKGKGKGKGKDKGKDGTPERCQSRGPSGLQLCAS